MTKRRRSWSGCEARRWRRRNQLACLVDVRPETARRLDAIVLSLRALRLAIRRRRGPVAVDAITDLLNSAESDILQARGAMLPSLVDDGILP